MAGPHDGQGDAPPSNETSTKPNAGILPPDVSPGYVDPPEPTPTTAPSPSEQSGCDEVHGNEPSVGLGKESVSPHTMAHTATETKEAYVLPDLPSIEHLRQPSLADSGCEDTGSNPPSEVPHPQHNYNPSRPPSRYSALDTPKTAHEDAVLGASYSDPCDSNHRSLTSLNAGQASHQRLHRSHTVPHAHGSRRGDSGIDTSSFQANNDSIIQSIQLDKTDDDAKGNISTEKDREQSDVVSKFCRPPPGDSWTFPTDCVPGNIGANSQQHQQDFDSPRDLPESFSIQFGDYSTRRCIDSQKQALPNCRGPDNTDRTPLPITDWNVPVDHTPFQVDAEQDLTDCRGPEKADWTPPPLTDWHISDEHTPVQARWQCLFGCGSIINAHDNLGLCTICHKEFLEKTRAFVLAPCEETAEPATSLTQQDMVDNNQLVPQVDPIDAHTTENRATPSTSGNTVMPLPALSPTPMAKTSPKVHRKKKSQNRCDVCNKKTKLMGFSCWCGGSFCISHRNGEDHKCLFDYKTAGRDQIKKENPRVVADKIKRIN